MKSFWTLVSLLLLLVSASAVKQEGGTSTSDTESASPVDSVVAFDLPTLPESSYIGSDRCVICHRKQAETWSSTKHAEAFDKLPVKYRDDTSCLKCHLTGLGEPGGYTPGMSPEEAQPFQSVGCESCHGPGAAHEAAVKRWTLSDPSDEERLLGEIKEAIIKVPTDSQCASCHTRQTHGTHPFYDGQPPQPVVAGHGGGHVANPATLPPSPDSYSVKTCGSCHNTQYKSWRTETHSELSAGLPAQYANDASCSTCHRKTGDSSDWYTANPLVVNEVGVGCESCHGPALKHVLFNKQHISGLRLEPETVEAARVSIRGEEPPTNCIKCHVGEAHQAHPEFTKPENKLDEK